MQQNIAQNVTKTSVSESKNQADLIMKQMSRLTWRLLFLIIRM